MAAAQPEPATIDLTTTQYVILAENQRKKKALAEARERCSQLAAENASLVQQLDEQRREGYTVTELFRSEVLAKNTQIAQLQADLEAARRDKAQQAARLQEAAAAREAQLQRAAEAAQQELFARADALQAELDCAIDFKQRQSEYEGLVAALHEEAQGLREALAAQKAELERYYAGANAKMRKEYEQRLEELKHAQDEELEERLDASVKRVLTHNRHLAEELRLHVQESDVLQSEVRILEAERQRMLRDLALRAELEEGFARRGAAQGAALKQAQERVTALEASLAQVLSDFQAEKTAVIRQADTQVSDARAETEALRRLLRLKARELKTLRRLGQEALLQRSEAEIFLISSLHMVRQELERERQEQQQTTQLPSQPAEAPVPVPAPTQPSRGSWQQGYDLGAAAQGQQREEGREGGGAGGGGCGPSSGEAEEPAAPGAPSCDAPAGPAGGGREGAAAARAAPLSAAAAAAGGAAGAAALMDVGNLSWEQREKVLRLLFARVVAHTDGRGGGGG